MLQQDRTGQATNPLVSTVLDSLPANLVPLCQVLQPGHCGQSFT